MASLAAASWCLIIPSQLPVHPGKRPQLTQPPTFSSGYFSSGLGVGAGEEGRWGASSEEASGEVLLSTSSILSSQPQSPSSTENTSIWKGERPISAQLIQTLGFADKTLGLRGCTPFKLAPSP